MGAARPCVMRLAQQRHVLLSVDLGSVVPSVACAIGVVPAGVAAWWTLTLQHRMLHPGCLWSKLQKKFSWQSEGGSVHQLSASAGDVLF